MSRTLYGIAQSPWTERARWALDHHGLAYAYHEHVPLIGEVLLRMKARSTKASVPLLEEEGDRTVMGSVDIARHAERSGKGAALFPAEHVDAIGRWTDAAERMLNVGRAWLTKRIVRSKDALAESLPDFVPGALRGALAPSAALGVRFIHRKWSVPEDVDQEVARTLRPILDDVRAALGTSPGYVLSTAGFTMADLVLASAMQVIAPHGAAPMGPATAEAWTNPALVRDYADLLAWRDAVYAKHR